MPNSAARIVIWLAAGVVLVVAGVWAVLPWFISSEVVRSAIERQLADITGQPVNVAGRVEIDIFPAPVARLHNLRVPGPNDSSGMPLGDVLTIDMLEVGIPLSSLIARDPGFSQFRLVRPSLRVHFLSDGTVNLARSGGRFSEAVAAIRRSESAEAPGGLPLEARQAGFGAVTIENGTVEFIDAAATMPEKITAISGTVTWPQLSGRLTSSLNGIWRGAVFSQTLEMDEAIRLFAGQSAAVRFGLDSDILSYSFGGTVSTGNPLFAEGAVALETQSVRQALDWLELDIEPGRAIGEMSLKGQMRVDAHRMRFENMDVVLQGNSGMGVLEIGLGKKNPDITATLDFVDLDILSFLSAFTGVPPTAGRLAQPVSAAFIDQLNVDLRLSAARATAGRLALTDVAAITRITDEYAVFEMAEGSAYGGTMQARFKIGRTTDGLSGELGFSHERVNTGALADALGLTGLIPRGQSTGDLLIHAPIERWSDLVTRANGKVQLTVVNGQIAGIGPQLFLGADGQQRFFRLQDTSRSTVTFDTLRIQGLVQDGVVIIENGAIEYPRVTIGLNGVIPYGSRSLALTAIARSKARTNGTGAPVVQHFIGGAWSNPYATPILLPQTGP
ncbi:AsmA family protein [Oricola cellulosilytica]|nr:AsmA-like C-terminal region-containing protein [Oricola cellulosilytica]